MDEDYLAALATQRIPVDRVKECREAARMVVLRNLNTQKAALLADLERKRKRPMLSLGAVPMFPPPPQQQQQWVSSSSSLSEVDTTQPLMNLMAEEVMPADGQPQVGFAPWSTSTSAFHPIKPIAIVPAPTTGVDGRSGKKTRGLPKTSVTCLRTGSFPT